MLLTKPEDLIRFTINEVRGKVQLSWAKGLTFSLPTSVFINSVGETLTDKSKGVVIFDRQYDVDEEVITAIRTMNAFTLERPLSSRLPFSYHTIPVSIRNVIAKVMVRFKRRLVEGPHAFPQWPVDLTVDFLTDLVGKISAPFSNRATPVVLTHDIDSPEGFRHLSRFLDAEEVVGARSTAFLVPCSWELDHNFLDEMAERGHEVAVHGVDHSNKTPYCSAKERKARLEMTLGFVKRHKVRGYRSPSLLRSKGLLNDLAAMYAYDSSIPTSGGLFPIPNNGCATARPFWIEGVCELPLTMPRDGSLIFMGYKPKDILLMWIRSAELISASGGVVVLLTHCEKRFSGSNEMFEIYLRFLNYISISEKYCFSSPNDVIGKTCDQNDPCPKT